MRVGNGQITLHVDQHPNCREDPSGGYISAELGIQAVEIDRDLQPGEHVTVSIANADGEIIGTATQEVGGIGFKPMKLEKRVIGTIRAHKAKIVYEA